MSSYIIFGLFVLAYSSSAIPLQAYNIYNRQNYCLTVDPNTGLAAAKTVAPCNGSTYQDFSEEVTPDSVSYSWKNSGSGLCLDGGGSGSTTEPSQSACTPTSKNQQWHKKQFFSYDPKHNFLVNVLSGLCLTWDYQLERSGDMGLGGDIYQGRYGVEAKPENAFKAFMAPCGDGDTNQLWGQREETPDIGGWVG